eukprot:CAMPEP_0176242736 /NCGR_PEP_ID=MMETSP0121_2-20121125/30560_1 /TAXON_ID=160619 /ORGANISM="Kryptoperidinium foliaceum, Strain CCMP 1326" /LENGTH=37 /DNA_ID= /DNA_START= /DNA_END= /DNA_ORIENTATION=
MTPSRVDGRAFQDAPSRRARARARALALPRRPDALFS